MEKGIDDNQFPFPCNVMAQLRLDKVKGDR